MRPTEEPVAVDLSVDERSLLVDGVASWSGPGYRPEIVARALGLGGRSDLRRVVGELEEGLGSGQLMPPSAWARALLMTEVGFVSLVAGQGSQWQTVTGRGDAETVALLRQIQRKLAPILRKATEPWFLSGPRSERPL
jgi:hypothetical protein